MSTATSSDSLFYAVYIRATADTTIKRFEDWLKAYKPIDNSHVQLHGENYFSPTKWSTHLLSNKRIRFNQSWKVKGPNGDVEEQESIVDMVNLLVKSNEQHDLVSIDIVTIATARIELQIDYDGYLLFPYFQRLVSDIALLWPSAREGDCQVKMFDKGEIFSTQTMSVSDFIAWKPEENTNGDSLVLSTVCLQPEETLATPISQKTKRPYFAYPNLKESEAIDRLTKAKVGLEIKGETKSQWAEIQRKVGWAYGDTAESRKKLYEEARKKYKNLEEQKKQYADLFAKVEAKAKELRKYQVGKAGS